MDRGTASGKRVQANLGAKNHAVVMPDGKFYTVSGIILCAERKLAANQNHAINAILGAAFGAAGQRCMAISVGKSVSMLSENTLANGDVSQSSSLVKQKPCSPNSSNVPQSSM